MKEERCGSVSRVSTACPMWQAGSAVPLPFPIEVKTLTSAAPQQPRECNAGPEVITKCQCVFSVSLRLLSPLDHTRSRVICPGFVDSFACPAKSPRRSLSGSWCGNARFLLHRRNRHRDRILLASRITPMSIASADSPSPQERGRIRALVTEVVVTASRMDG